MNFTTTTNGRMFKSAEGYVIVRDGTDAPVYWTAYRPGGIDPAHELAGGAGDAGWLKCIEYCRRHHALPQGAVSVVKPTCEATHKRQVQGTEEAGNDRPAAPSSNNNNSSVQQQTLL